MENLRVVSAEVVDTMSNQGKEYSGSGNFLGNVLVELTYSDGSVIDREVDGEHSEKDILVNYNDPNYWNA